MVKELRTQTVGLRVGRVAQLTSEEESCWNLSQTQTFTPPLEVLFKTENLATPGVYGIKLSEPLQKVVDSERIQVGNRTIPVHRKTTSILSPFRWMRGDYGSIGLPTTTEDAEDLQKKLQSPHTAAYVGALANTVLSESECPNFPKVYGVYCGIAKQHTVDISDDYEELSLRPWFAQNVGKTFQLRMRAQSPGTPQFKHTRGARPALQLGEHDFRLDDIEDLDSGTHIQTPTATSLSMDEIPQLVPEEEVSDEEDSESTTSTAQVYEIESCDCSTDAGSYHEDVSEDGDEPFAWADLANIPVVTTVMERCEGTLYDLLESDPDPSHHAAYVAQVVFALAYAQRVFSLVHNDLHGNNVMYVTTNQAYINYNLGGVLYKVPTYGRLIKIIDFDRAVLSVRLAGSRDGKVFMSDQFQEDEEAGGQYNVEPFYNPKHPEIKPNPSFDLVRLATSLFWDLFPEGPREESSHPLKSIFIRWMTLPDQTSILYREGADNHDRYHGFHLYKAIARYCKDTAVPRKEPALAAFKVDRIQLGEPCVIIEA